MKIRSKIAVTMIISMLLVPLNVVSASTDYNMPTTSIGDTNKTSPCEVTADIHYAYYVSMPASLTLEPTDSVMDAEKYAKLLDTTTYEFLEGYGTDWHDTYNYSCWYQVKAKMKEGGLGGKYIKVAPRSDKESFITASLQEGKTQEDIEIVIENGYLDCRFNDECGCYEVGSCLQHEDTGHWDVLAIMQKRIYFGDTASEKVVKVGTEKWSGIDGNAFAYLSQGRYKGNFEFVYGLVDSIDD